MPASSVFDLDIIRPLTAATDAATTLTAAQIIDGIVTMTPTTGRALTTPTGAQIIAGLGDSPAVGATFQLTVVNAAAATHAITLTAGASGVTLAGVAAMATVAAATSATYLFRIATATTVIVYRKGG
tara:strand:- start:918 stop:1298 length:381 start_codon:yes stop_codon:yes gene_type:complete